MSDSTWVVGCELAAIKHPRESDSVLLLQWPLPSRTFLVKKAVGGQAL